MKLLNIPAMAAFALSAYAQLNDPDPWLWVVYYVAATLVCILFLFGLSFRILPILVGVVGVVWVGLLIPELQAAEDPVVWAQVFGQVEMKTLSVELTREIGGLCIVIVWMAFLTGSASRG